MNIFSEIFAIFFLLFLVSCESDQDDTTVFKGILLTYESGQPTSGVKVILNRNDGVNFQIDTNKIGEIEYLNSEYDTIITEENGSYYFSTLRNEKSNYSVDIASDDYIKLFGQLNTSVKQSSVNEDSLIIGKSTYLKLNLINNHNDTNDSIYINIIAKTNFFDIYGIDLPTKKLYLYPQRNDTVLIYKFSFDMYETTEINWKIVDKEESTEEIKEIKLFPIDTTSFTIEF